MKNLIDLLTRHWKISLPIGVLIAALGAWLVFGVFGVQTLFFDETVDEALPFQAGPGASGIPSDEITDEEADEMNKTMEEEGIPEADPVTEPMPEEVAQIIEVATGSFVDRSHPTSGTAKVLESDGVTILRLEDFETDNGPDLNVYLTTAAPDAPAGDFDDDFIDLGDLKGNIGNQNYELPDGVDVGKYTTVVIWCVRFGVAFGAAPLTTG